MANNATNVLAAKPKLTGGIRWAPITTAAPVDATTPLAAAFKTAGFVSDGGLTKAINTSDDELKDWGATTVKILRTEKGQEYSFELIEAANADVLKLIHGEENVEEIAATATTNRQIIVKQKNDLPEAQMFVFDMMDSPANLREVVGTGIATVSGDVAFVSSDVIKYSVTLKCIADAEGTFATTYFDDGRKLVVAG